MNVIGIALLVVAVTPPSSIQIETRCLGGLTPISVTYTSSSLVAVEIRSSSSLSNSNLYASKIAGGIFIRYREKFKDGDEVFIRTIYSNKRSDLSDRMLSAGQMVPKHLIEYFSTAKMIVDDISKDAPINEQKVRDYFTRCPIR